MRLLLVDDDELLTQTLVKNLIAQHYTVDLAADGKTGWDYAQSVSYDLIVLDINLPKLNGISLCQKLRKNGYQAPILLLTSREDSVDKVTGLDAGADDYVVKPCMMDELCARIRALLRRQNASTSPILVWGNLHLNPSTCSVTYEDQPLSLSPKEYGLLELFLRNPQRVFSSSIILEHLWGFEETPGDETVRTHIKRLRRKLKAASAEEIIETVYGMGYRLKPVAASPPASPASTSPLSTVDQTRAAAIAAWEQFKQPHLERLAVLDRAVAALQTSTLPEDLHQEAMHTAHKLAGSLGMFGFPAGSQLAKQIEQWFRTTSSAANCVQLQSMVVELHQVLQQPPQPMSEDWFSSLGAETSPQSTPSNQGFDLLQDVLQRHQPVEVKVLAVDDDPLVLEMLQHCLPRWGIHLTTLNDPRQCWETLIAMTPDLLVLDVDMPYLSGLELCQAIRGEPTWGGLPILFLSAQRDAQTVVRLYSAGADDYVAKPFTEPEVVTRIFNRLERNRLLQSLERSRHQGDF
ncbi:MAG: response regulator [Leptolyngbyaceae cyanobacterium RU_5_1]|nr:response regulator [Leptolyngbyaceae cyanobacterium RU_5_1]